MKKKKYVCACARTCLLVGLCDVPPIKEMKKEKIENWLRSRKHQTIGWGRAFLAANPNGPSR